MEQLFVVWQKSNTGRAKTNGLLDFLCQKIAVQRIYGTLFLGIFAMSSGNHRTMAVNKTEKITIHD